MFDDLSDEVLESELCSQAANLSAGECHLLLVMGELERREVWARQGARDCAHWLSWRIGTALGAAREQLRVARALEHLEHTRAAFASGELSYSKVRAITRVADEHSDAELVGLARAATAAQLEQIVREYRRADPGEQARANAAHARRYLRHRSDGEGMILINARLDPEEAAVVLAAIERAREELASQAGANRGDVSAETSSDPGAGPQSVEPDAAEDPSDPLEQLIDKSDPFEQRAADALVAICAAALSAGISEVEDPHVSVLVHVDEPVLKDPTAPGCAHVEGLGAISAHAAARLACEGALSRLVYRADGAVEPLGTTKVIPRSMRRALLARDRGCRFPGCTARRFLHAHHVIYASRGGPTALSNLVTLCGRHHRLVHDGGWKLSLSHGGQLRVVSADGSELAAVARAGSGSTAGLATSNAGRGVRLSPDALTGDGDPCDIGLAIDALLCLASQGAETSAL